MSASGIATPLGIGWRHVHNRELVERQPALDFLEVHSENFFGAGGAALAVLERGRQDCPISLHGVGLPLGSACGLDAWHLDQLAALVERIEPLRVSEHVCFARALWPAHGEVHATDLLPIPFSHEALAVLSANVATVQDRLKRRFMVENLSADVAWQTPEQDLFGAEVDFLIDLTRRTGCASLVDVNNLYVNARNAQIAGLPGDPMAHCRAGLDAVPATCVGEIHLAGHVHVANCPDGQAEQGRTGTPDTAPDGMGGIWIDDHGSRVADTVWQL